MRRTWGGPVHGQCLADLRHERQRLDGAALAANDQLRGAPPDVVELEAGHLARAQPQPREQQQDREVTSPLVRVSITRGQHEIDLLGGEVLRHASEPPPRDGGHHAGEIHRDLSLLEQEAEEGPQDAHVGLVRAWGYTVGSPQYEARDVLFSQSMEPKWTAPEAVFEEPLNDGNIAGHRGGHQRTVLLEVLAETVRQGGGFGAFRQRLLGNDALCSQMRDEASHGLHPHRLHAWHLPPPLPPELRDDVVVDLGEFHPATIEPLAKEPKQVAVITHGARRVPELLRHRGVRECVPGTRRWCDEAVYCSYGHSGSVFFVGRIPNH